MTTLSSPASIFEHTLDPLSGYDKERGLAFTANLSANVTIIPYPGRVGHLNSVGEWEMGVTGKQMPCYLMPPSHPLGHQPTVSPYWQGVGKYPLTGLPATAGLELATTEYDSERTFAVNDLLTAIASNSDQDTGGLLTNVNGSNVALTPPYIGATTTRTVCGMVSKPPVTLKNKNTVLSLWTLVILGST